MFDALRGSVDYSPRSSGLLRRGRYMDIELTAGNPTLSEFEAILFQDAPPGIEMREVYPADPVLRSADWGSVVLSLSSAASLKVFKDAFVGYVTSRRCKLTISDRQGNSVTFEGPSADLREVQSLVDGLTAEQPQE